MKEHLKVKYYFRYCDDIVILSDKKEKLWDYFYKIKKFLTDKLKLTIKSNYMVFPVKNIGINFLGYVVKHNGNVKLRKSIKIKAFKKLKKLKSERKITSVLGSFYGWAKHSNKNIFYYTVINNKKVYKLYKSMKFKNMKLNISSNGDKKMFDCDLVSLSDLINEEIEIIDFETGITTSFGENRCVVKIKVNNENKKFITSSIKMMNELAAIKDQYSFPFTTTIKKSKFQNGKFRYVLS